MVIIGGIGGAALWQRENISAVVDASKYSDEDIKQQITDSKKVVETELEQYNVSGLRDFTFEEEEQIRKGQLTVEEAVERIMSESNVSGGSQEEQAGEGQGSQVETSADIVSEYTVKLYSLKAQYLGEIGNLIDQAKDDYKNGSGAKALMSKYLGQASSLEKEADTSVDTLLSELKGKLEAVGADTGIIDTMKSSYQNEKTLKKSYYLSLFNKKK